jgi:dTDP-4-dehydrorhamnose reductase
MSIFGSPVLVTGAAGLLGAHVIAMLAENSEVVGVDRHEWWEPAGPCWERGELSDPGFRDRIVRQYRPKLVIHCAALVDVDRCEREPAAAEHVNAEVTRDWARSVGPDCTFVYISTDSVFKGTAPFATEQDLPCPRNAYARTKLRGEWEVQLATDRHLIIRTNIYGWSSRRKKTSAEWLYDALRSGAALTLFDDVFFTPIYVVDFVGRLEALITAGATGIVHVVGADRVSKLEFGMMMARLGGFSTGGVGRGSVHDAAFHADRPADMSLRSTRFDRFTALVPPSCESGLRRFLGDGGRSVAARMAAHI